MIRGPGAACCANVCVCELTVFCRVSFSITGPNIEEECSLHLADI